MRTFLFCSYVLNRASVHVCTATSESLHMLLSRIQRSSRSSSLYRISKRSDIPPIPSKHFHTMGAIEEPVLSQPSVEKEAHRLSNGSVKVNSWSSPGPAAFDFRSKHIVPCLACRACNPLTARVDQFCRRCRDDTNYSHAGGHCVHDPA